MFEVIKTTLSLIGSLSQTNDDRELRRNVRAIKRNRRKIYRQFKKDGLTDEEKNMLRDIDHAWVQATLELGKF